MTVEEQKAIDDKAKSDGLAKQMASLTARLTALEGENTELKTFGKDLETANIKLNEQLLALGEAGLKTKFESDDKDTNLDSFSPSELHAFTVKSIEKLLDSKLKGVGDEVNAVKANANSQIANERIARDIDKLKAGNPVFAEYYGNPKALKRMKDFAVANPTLTVKQVFTQILAEDKAETQVKVDADVKKAKEELKFISEEGGIPEELAKNKDLDGRNATVAAWDLVMGDNN